MFLFFRCHPISYFLYYVSQSIFVFSFLDIVFVINKDFLLRSFRDTFQYKSSDPHHSVPDLIHLKMIRTEFHQFSDCLFFNPLEE